MLHYHVIRELTWVIFTCIQKWLLRPVEKHGGVIGKKMILLLKCWLFDSVLLEYQGILMKNSQNSGNISLYYKCFNTFYNICFFPIVEYFRTLMFYQWSGVAIHPLIWWLLVSTCLGDRFILCYMKVPELQWTLL